MLKNLIKETWLNHIMISEDTTYFYGGFISLARGQRKIKYKLNGVFITHNWKK